MIGNKPGDASGQSLIFKIATAVILVLICGALFIIQKALRQTGETAGTYVKPAQEDILESKELPSSEEPESALSQPLPGSHPKLEEKELPPPEEPGIDSPHSLPGSRPKSEAPMPRIANRPVLPTIPSSPAPAPDRTPATAAGVRTLQAPLTEVHPLSDAERVMGAASSEVGEVGVTRTFKLPEDSGPNEPPSLPND
jgi:hypothetical protein